MTPIETGKGVWMVDGPVVRWLTMPFPTRMVICRLADGSLFVHSPVKLTPVLQLAIAELGTPRFIVSPNKLHHLFMADWKKAWPDAASFAPPGLRARRPDLQFQGQLGNKPEADWAGEIDQTVFTGSRFLEEVLFLHIQSRTLIVGDMIQNFDPATLSWPYRQIARAIGSLAPNGKTPLDLRLSFIGRRSAARNSLQRLLEWKPQAIIMCHGVPVLHDAESFLQQAFKWIGKATASDNQQ